MPRDLEDAVVVVTGASSGIGRASALAFARRGADVVVAARREEPLVELVREIEALGVDGLAVATDVTDEEAVERLAQRAEARFGRIDVWLNNAGVTLFARFEDSPPDAYARVIRTNLFGYVYGARAALRRFRRQGSGVLINNSSVFGTMAGPYVSAYIASKFAIRGLGESLRQELRDAEDIHVVTILPASIDTPLFQHAANYTGRAIKPLNPIIDPERVASVIVRLAERPRREATVGFGGRMLRATRVVAPLLYERLAARQVEIDHFKDEPAPATEGNVFTPVAEGTAATGGWRDGRTGRLGPLAGVAGAALIPAVVAVLWVKR